MDVATYKATVPESITVAEQGDQVTGLGRPQVEPFARTRSRRVAVRDEIQKLMQKDYYLDTQKALEIGIVDEILYRRVKPLDE
ncbi:hypothetical protein CNMCM5793_000062 [Aspergillus hiratsukae]|uniref:Uncharacterized protein n=1 Tax=Aspergillus hiratsukae TaxID=1194566 RepID=A0A8H6P9E3_9EURO|nr:hypothetical protein CNMCM5793_000062 [Aspergillus hiratsukae]KAF7160884.1 hypothetical protein CNMCM6106_008258 [Aspergillus hiratsukae]